MSILPMGAEFFRAEG